VEKEVVAVGEIGFDFHYLSKDEIFEKQKKVFIEQIELAIKYNLPIIVHSRDAFEETYDIVKQYSNNVIFILHSFVGNIEQARKYNILPNVYFGFSGIVTFKNAKEIQESAKFIPIEKIIIETDCPWLSPEPNRGKTNYPKNIKYIFKFLSNLKNINEHSFEKVIQKNVEKIFGIK